MPRKEFEAFTRLDASDVNTFLMDQSVMTFGSATARDAAIDTPVEGMVAYLNDSNTMSIYDGSAWGNSLSPVGGILQVVTGTTTTSTSTTSTSFQDTTLTATITPKFSTSNILVLVGQCVSTGNNGSLLLGGIQLLRGATKISGFGANYNIGANLAASGIQEFHAFYSETILDSPATTSATTYKTQIRSRGGGTESITCQSFSGRSNITLLEVSA
jgi:hypothetical protein